MFAKLKKNQLVKSVRGPGGGYKLGDKGSKIVISEIIRAVDELPIKLLIPDVKNVNSRQLTDLLWQALEEKISLFLNEITLADVVNCTLFNKMGQKSAITSSESESVSEAV